MSSIAARPLPGTTWDPFYPDSESEEMGETDFHAVAMIALREALQDFFAERMDVYVASNLLFYYEQGNPAGHRDPDVLVARGVVGNHLRRSFRTWEEGTLPCVLFEMSSERTWRVDVGEKRALYARLGIPEYFLFDPEGKFLDPVLQGFRLENGVSTPLAFDADGALTSRELGLRLLPEGTMLRLIDAQTGIPLLTRAERTQALADEVARLRTLLQKHQSSQE